MRKLWVICFVLCAVQCREQYAFIPDVPTSGLLVVEGIVNTTGDSKIGLSRTNALSATGIIPENGAVVTIESDDNVVYPLTALDSGRHFTSQLPLSPDKKYRLKIVTRDAKEYFSDFRSPLRTQQVDSISYVLNNNELQFYVNSTENTPAKYYFKYEWEETWQFNSSFRSIMKYVLDTMGQNVQVSVQYYDPVNHSVNESIYSCWQSRVSTSIDLGTTELLTQSRIFLPVRSIRRDSWEMSYIYSLLVRQYALSAEGYDFFRRMKKNSETLGSIFDAQPSDISGNIKSSSDPEEVVVGFVEFTSAQEKRIFVNSEDLPGPVYDPGCRIFQGTDLPYAYPFANDPLVLRYVYDSLDLLPTSFIEPLPGQIFFIMEESRCVDCTFFGSNIKPPFWP